LYVILFITVSFSSIQRVGSACAQFQSRPDDTIWKESDSILPSEGATPIILRFGGDCLLAEHYERAVGDEIDWAFTEFDLFQMADVAMVNLECPITTRGKKFDKPFNFRMDPKFVSAIKNAGIDIVNIANNHIFDYDNVGVFDTILYLDSLGIHHVGGGRNNDEAHRPVLVHVSGRRIGFLGYYEGGEAPAATATSPGVARRDIGLITRDVQALRSQDSVDYVVVNLHWGTEKADTPDTWQVEFAHKIIDAGADAVVGHHPHVLQGIERYKSGVIAYSLGNLIFGGNSRSSYDTGILEIVLRESRVDYRFIPVRVTDWKAHELKAESADSLRNYVDYLSIPLSKIMSAQEAK
jgi:poly-gamma-glutamate synthesis protein (capsule biosynthesis protein)